MKKNLSVVILSLIISTNAFSDVYKGKAFNCEYYHTSIGEIKNNKYKVDSEKENNFGFNIININLDTGKSQIVGNMGTDNLTTINAAPSGIHFIQMMPGIPKAKVKSRVILTPQHAKRFMKALSENVRKFENQHGEIKDIDPTKGIPMNFGGPTPIA